MFITQWSTLLPMTDFYPHLPSHLDLYCKSCSYFICSFLPSVPYVFIPFLFYVPSLHFMCDCLLFMSYAFIKHLYVVTLLPSFITLCEPVFCVCVVCYVYCCASCIMYWYQSPCHRQLSTLDAMYLQWIFTNSSYCLFYLGLVLSPWPPWSLPVCSTSMLEVTKWLEMTLEMRPNKLENSNIRSDRWWIKLWPEAAKAYTDLTSNPGFPFQFLSCSFGEKSKAVRQIRNEKPG